jgi:selT/selW/selH-like putative selenoprotein
LRFEVDNYPVPPLKAFIAQACSGLFMVGLLVGLAGRQYLPPAANAWIGENTTLFYGGLFVLNMLGSSLAQTGAFELYLDDKLVHSKLESGGLPDVNGLASLLQQLLAA